MDAENEEKRPVGRPRAPEKDILPPEIPACISVEGLKQIFPEIDMNEEVAAEITEVIEMVVSGDSIMAGKKFDDIFFHKAQLFKKYPKVAETFIAMRRFDVVNITESLVQRAVIRLKGTYGEPGEIEALKPNQLVDAVEKLSKVSNADHKATGVDLTFIINNNSREGMEAKTLEIREMFGRNPALGRKLLGERTTPDPS